MKNGGVDGVTIDIATLCSTVKEYGQVLVSS